MTTDRLAVVLVLATALLGAGCTGGSGAEPRSVEVDPLMTVRRLLALHDLDGRQPEERTRRSREKEVDREALDELFLDLDRRERFIADLYVGFVVGALARNQTRLFVTRKGKRAEVTAGRTRIVMKPKNHEWRIVLEESVPDEIKARAAAEKRRFERARVASQITTR